MKGLSTLVLLAASLAVGVPVSAEAASPEKLTPFLGERYRYPSLILPLRFAADLVAIPASVPRWDQEDFAVLATCAGVVGALMTPTGAQRLSADTRLQRYVMAGRPPGEYLVWTPTGDTLIWVSIWGAMAGYLAYGWYSPDPEALEAASLTLEAFAVAQVSQLALKFVLGREGPRDGAALGTLYGPKGFFRLFPAGTPSGHATTLYAMLGALSTYWQSPMLDVGMHLFGLLFCITLVTDNYHFVSDVVWGAALGYCEGRWIVRNRSTRYRYEKDGGLVPYALVPLVAPASGSYGLSAAWRF